MIIKKRVKLKMIEKNQKLNPRDKESQDKLISLAKSRLKEKLKSKKNK